MGKLFRVLSIDGGGMRGILSGELLVALEKKIQKKSGNPAARIADYFDMVAGNSTGGILTCLYLCPDDENPTRPKYSAEDAVDIYLKHGQEIFRDDMREKILMTGGMGNETYPVENFIKLLESYFSNKKLSDLLRPCIIPAYNIEKRSTHFFTQHDAVNDKGSDFYLKDIARATSAAPAYFAPALISSLSKEKYPLVDGGVFANNPALCAFAEARHKFNTDAGNLLTANDMYIVSIGTGSEKRSLAYDEAKGWGAIGWVFPVLDIVISGATDTVDFQLKQIFESVDKGENYIRISPELGNAKPEMDNASNFNLQALKAAGEKSAKVHDETLELIAERIVKG